MTDRQFIVIYDALAESFWLRPSLMVLAVLAGMAFILWMLRSALRERKAARALFLLALFVFWGVAASVVFGVVRGYWRCYDAARHGGAKVVEGVVRDFQFERYKRETRERFSIGEEAFAYDSGSIAHCGFNRGWRDEGPFRNGVHARITHHDGAILKIELATEPRP